MCLEGPEAGVYYRGEGHIDKISCIITLPSYVEAFANDFSVQITAIYNSDNIISNIRVSRVIDGKFTVYADGRGDFFWTVFGKRHNIAVELCKDEINIQGNGPYKWYEKC